jgi:N4-gp56 family major capsid protein
MSKTSFATNDSETKKVWDEKLYRDMKKMSFFDKFKDTSSDSIVHVKTQLSKQQGDAINFGIRMRLTGAGVSGSTVLEGNEEKLVTKMDTVTLDFYRHAVRDAGAMDRQRAMFSIDEEARNALADWGSEKIDQLAFDAILASPTRVLYNTSSGLAVDTGGSGATAKSTITAADSKATPALLSALKTHVLTGGIKAGVRSFVPFRPIKIKNKNYVVFLTSQDVIYDLKQNSVIQTSWQQAAERGIDNPLFNDAEIIWDGVIVYGHENIPIASDGGAGSNVTWSKSCMLGAQALVWGEGQKPETVQETFDYGNEHGYAWGMIAKCKKPVFNSQDYGSVGVYVSNTNVSGL